MREISGTRFACPKMTLKECVPPEGDQGERGGLVPAMPVINKVTVMKKGAKKVLNSFLCRLTF